MRASEAYTDRHRTQLNGKGCCEMALTGKQEVFVAEYIKLGNAYQAALNAGYKESSAVDSSKWINPDILNSPSENERKKFRPKLYAALLEEMEKLKKPTIAEAEEVLEYLTTVLRGESRSHVLARDYNGAEHVIEKPPDEKERLRAAELMGKRYGLWDKKQEADTEPPNDGFVEALRGEVEEVWQAE